MSPRIYLDHAATTPIHPEVWASMSDIQASGFGNPSSIHHEGRFARTLIEEARKTLARYMNASLGEVFFTSCGTESNNMILTGAVRDLGVTRILTSRIEHPCVIQTVRYLEKLSGIGVVWVPLLADGRTDTTALQQILAREPQTSTLVSLMHVNNELGVINDLAEIGGLCRQYNAFFHTDAVQSIGFQPFDVATIPVDFIGGSAHKFYGPKGCGFVYIRAGIGIQPFLHGGSQERNMRAGTENTLGIHGMGTALAIAQREGSDRNRTLAQLRMTLRESLAHAVPGVTFNEAPDPWQSPKILSVNFPPSPRTDLLLMHLDIEGISASGGSACSSGAEVASPVLQYLAIPAGTKTLRFSFSPANTVDEMVRVSHVLQRLMVAP